MYIKMSHFYSGRMVSGDCKNLTFWYPYVEIGTPRYPQVVEKYLLFVFYSYLHHSEPFLLWSDAIWWDIKNSTFRHPCVVVCTLGTPRWSKNIFQSVFLHIYIIPSHFCFGRAQSNEISKIRHLGILRGRRYPKVPPDGRKIIFNRFSCIFTPFWAIFTLVECNLQWFSNKTTFIAHFLVF